MAKDSEKKLRALGETSFSYIFLNFPPEFNEGMFFMTQEIPII